MPSTPAERRSVAWLYTGIIPPTPTPGSTPPAIRQQIGWGYSGLPVGEEAPEPPAVEIDRFVYRPLRRRLRARKRAFS